MSQDVTLHVKLDRETDDRLKRLAKSRGTSKGQLVREALGACYQTASSDLPATHQQALAAYRGGYISIGKLGEVMGLHALEMRRWLTEHGIPQRTGFGAEDAAHA